jgi:hypothetical protein
MLYWLVLLCFLEGCIHALAKPSILQDPDSKHSQTLSDSDAPRQRVWCCSCCCEASSVVGCVTGMDTVRAVE